MKINAQNLALTGYTEAQIDRYYTLLDRKNTRGLGAISPDGRRFMLAARKAIDTLEAAHLASLVAGRKNRLVGKTPVESKLHYRWTETEIAAYTTHTELAVDEVSANVVVMKEILRALSLYQPVLDMLDTSKRGSFNQPVSDLLGLAMTYERARLAQFDSVAVERMLQSEFPNNWNEKWSNQSLYSEVSVVAIPLADELDFIGVIRPEIERLTREIYPSVAVAA